MAGSGLNEYGSETLVFSIEGGQRHVNYSSKYSFAEVVAVPFPSVCRRATDSKLLLVEKFFVFTESSTIVRSPKLITPP